MLNGATVPFVEKSCISTQAVDKIAPCEVDFLMQFAVCAQQAGSHGQLNIIFMV